MSENEFAVNKIMVHLEGETSNTLFEVLEDWENQLKHADFSELKVEFVEPQP